jgi:hypothetical protein
MLDAAALEKLGIHTVTIVWDTFERAAKMHARVQGIPDAKLVVTPHREGHDTLEVQQEKARTAAAEIVKLLLAS